MTTHNTTLTPCHAMPCHTAFTTPHHTTLHYTIRRDITIKIYNTIPHHTALLTITLIISHNCSPHNVNQRNTVQHIQHTTFSQRNYVTLSCPVLSCLSCPVLSCPIFRHQCSNLNLCLSLSLSVRVCLCVPLFLSLCVCVCVCDRRKQGAYPWDQSDYCQRWQVREREGRGRREKGGRGWRV